MPARPSGFDVVPYVATLVVVAGVVTGCAPAPQPATSSTPAAVEITGASGCPADQAQDITFSGGVTGHIACSLSPTNCRRIHGPQSPGVQVLILALAGTKTITLRIAFGNDHLGTFPATPIGDEPNLDQQGVTLTGIGSWSISAGGGTMRVFAEESPSLAKEGRVSGWIDVKLSSGSSTTEVQGAWTCFKVLAGGDGWSSA